MSAAMKPLDELAPDELMDLVKAKGSDAADAFAEVCKRYRKHIMRAITHYRIGWHDAEDVYQTALLRIWKNVDHYRKPNTLGGWLYRVAELERLYWFEKKTRTTKRETDLDSLNFVNKDGEVKAFDIPDPRSILPSLEEELHLDYLSAFNRAFARLDIDVQYMLRMYYVNDMPTPWLAQWLGIPEGSVRYKIRSALMSLRAALGVTPCRYKPSPAVLLRRNRIRKRDWDAKYHKERYWRKRAFAIAENVDTVLGKIVAAPAQVAKKLTRTEKLVEKKA